MSEASTVAADLSDLAERLRVDGVAVVRGVFADWVPKLIKAVEDRERSGASSLVDVTATEGGQGRFAMDRQVWWQHATFRDFLLRSACIDTVREALSPTTRVTLLDDQLFLKHPGTSNVTPWHQDWSFWAVDGERLCSMWIALDSVTSETGRLEFVRGSHRFGSRFQAVGVRADATLLDPGHESIEDSDRSHWELVGYDLEPGDALVFHALTLHGAAGNNSAEVPRRGYVSRWAGDDVVFAPREHSAPRHLRTAAAAGLVVGEPMDSEYYPTLWSKSAGTLPEIAAPRSPLRHPPLSH